MNPIIINILIALLSVLVGYLVGSIPTGVIVGKVFFHQDVRELGSKNSGGTNVARIHSFVSSFVRLALSTRFTRTH